MIRNSNGQMQSPAQAELDAINKSMERQSNLSSLRSKAFKAAEWAKVQLD